MRVDGLTCVRYRVDERAGLPHDAARRRPREQPGVRWTANVYVTLRMPRLPHCIPLSTRVTVFDIVPC